MHEHQLNKRWGWRGAIFAAPLVIVILAGCRAPDSSPATSPTPAASAMGDTWIAAMAGCLRDAGWDVAVGPAGDSYHANNLSGEQRPAYIEAEAACEAEVGPPPEVEPLSQAEIREHYRFLLDARECLIGLGYSISEPPSEDAFVESWTTGPWSPFNDVVEVVTTEEWERINDACPQS